MITIQYDESHFDGLCLQRTVSSTSSTRWDLFKSYYYYSVQFVRKKALAALSVKILKHCIQRNLSMCTRNWQKLITCAPLIVQLVNYIAKDGRQNHQFECFVSQSE